MKTIKKKQKHKGRGTVRTVTKTVPNDSFFNFFSPPDGKLPSRRLFTWSYRPVASMRSPPSVLFAVPENGELVSHASSERKTKLE